MEYILKNGTVVNLRKPTEEDAEQMVSLIKTADSETVFLARNPGEFHTTVEEERNIIKNTTRVWFVVEVGGKIVGQCSVGRINSLERYRHRASVAFVILKEYCDLGIGGKMMQECLGWCKENDITQVELDMVASNERAIRMYKNFGFEIIGIMPNSLKYLDGSYADEYLMVKKLK